VFASRSEGSPALRALPDFGHHLIVLSVESGIPAHTGRRGFDRTLEAIEAKIIELFGMVAEDLPAITQAFLDGRGDMATALAQHEQFVDALYRQVEELAGRELLLQAPCCLRPAVPAVCTADRARTRALP
jgi:hypothetical protein